MTRILVLISVFCAYFISSAGEVARPRGVAISKASLYAPGETFQCFDGSSVIPFDRINDDYCDCADGSDEPGTSACPNGSFHCTNAGYKPKYVPSSRVNDGICDCCDGTDEYNGKLTCANYCKELGRQFREDQEKERQLLLEGHEIYKEYSLKGKEALKEKRVRLDAAKSEKESAETRRDELEAKKLEAEGPEKEAKDKHKKAWDEEKEKQRIEKDRERARDAFDDLDADDDNIVTVSKIQSHPEFDIDSNGAVSVEEAKEYLEELEQVDYDTFNDKVWIHIRDIYRKPSAEDSTEPETKDEPKQEEPQHLDMEREDEDLEDDEMDDDDDEYDEDMRGDPEDYHIDDYDEDEADEPPRSSVFRRGRHRGDPGSYSRPAASKDEKEDAEMPPYDEETRLLIKAADDARFAYNDANAEVNKLDDEIKNLEKTLAIDFGPDSSYYPLNGECYEFTDREYTYKFCPFEKCTQRGKHGGVETSLGVWDNWSGDDSSKYLTMKYHKGQNCWNGPDRSVTVLISCGVDNQLRSSSEPNRCEYQYTFSTPAACSKPPEPSPKDPEHDEL